MSVPFDFILYINNPVEVFFLNTLGDEAKTAAIFIYISRPLQRYVFYSVAHLFPTLFKKSPGTFLNCPFYYYYDNDCHHHSHLLFSP